MPGFATLRTPGSNGAARSFCKTRRCTRSPNGAGSASAAPTYPLSSASLIWKARWRRSSSTPPRMLRCSRRCSTFRCRRSARLALAPEELRRRQMAALTNWVMAGARSQPMVLAFEDLHWADPTTLDVLRGIAERGALAPLLYRRDDAARVPAALEHAFASRHDLARAARPRPGARHGGGDFRPPRAAARGGRRTSPRAQAACRCSSRR